jgi:polysaccharide export outer membrane protein
MGKRIQMMRKNLHALLVMAAALILFGSPGVAQMGGLPGVGQAGGSPHGAASSSASSNNAGGNSVLGTVPADFAKLRLAPGFQMGLNVLDDPDFTGSFRIDEQGNIALPIVGTIHIAGETTSEARIQIRNILLEKKILKDPQVELAVLEYAAPEVTIIGEVANPGKHPLLAPHKLVDVLALAGGTTITAGNEVLITRGIAGGEPVLVHYSKATDPKTVESVIVYPGDTVQVKRAGIVYVLGAVNRPGGFVMQEEGTLSVLQAISLASGTTVLASTKTVYLLRRNPDGSVVYVALPLKKMTRGKSSDVQLHATDILYVPTSTTKLIYSNLQGIINSAAAVGIYAAAGY